MKLSVLVQDHHLCFCELWIFKVQNKVASNQSSRPTSAFSASLLQMAGLFPSVDQANGMKSVDDVVLWTGVPSAVWTAFTQKVGVIKSQHALAALSGEMVKRAAESAQVQEGSDTRALNMIEHAQLGLVWRVVRFALHLGAGGALHSFLDDDPFSSRPPAPLVAAPTIAPSAANVVPTEKHPGTGKVSLQLVIDQGQEGECEQVSPSKHKEWQDNYLADAKVDPRPECEPTIHQLSALWYRLTELMLSPFVDFAVWVPFGKKAMRANKYRTWLPTGNGLYISKLLPGPENFMAWTASWQVFEVAARSLKILTQQTLEHYFNRVKDLVRDHGEAWHLIVEGDAKAREDEAFRKMRTLLRKVDNKEALPLDYCAEMKWDCVFRMLAEDEQFWNRNVVNPSNRWSSKGRKGVPLCPHEELMRIIAPGSSSWSVPLEKMVSDANGSERLKRNWAHAVAEDDDKQMSRNKRRKVHQRQRSQQTIQGQYGGAQNRGGPRETSGGKRHSYYPEGSGSPRPFGKQHQSQGSGNSGPSSKSEACIAANKSFGTCRGAAPGSACRQGRAHICMKCGGSDHFIGSCPSAGFR